MSGSVTSQIAALELQISNLYAQIAVDVVSNPGAIPGLQAQITLDNQQILTLQALCFASGTHILTERGEIPIERLEVGDMVVTPFGATDCMPIRWIGRQHFEGARAVHGQPVLIRMNALGEGLPHRDMRVSADHSIFIDGCLIPAKLLVNGTTIVAETGLDVVDYVNIELDSHTIVIAEGIESESYLDCGNRARFDNAHEPCEWLASRSERDGSAWVNGTAFAVPLWDGPEFDAVLARLAGRAADLSASYDASDVLDHVVLHQAMSFELAAATA